MLKKIETQKGFLELVILIIILLSSCSGLDLTKEDKSSAEKLLDKGRYYYNERDYDLAIEVFQMVIKKYKEIDTFSASWAQYEMGMSYYLDGDETAAMEAFRNVLVKYPLPRQPRILASKLIQKIKRDDGHKRSSYLDD